MNTGEVAKAVSLETRLYDLFPTGCVEYPYDEGSGLQSGPCSVVGLAVSLALAKVEMGKITEDEALERVRSTALKVGESGCKGIFLTEPGCFGNPHECGQNAEGFNEYIN